MTHRHPTQEDPVVAGLSEAVGGPVGDHAGRHPWWTPRRVLLLLAAVVFALGVVQKAPCSLGASEDTEATYAQMCYTDLRPLYIPRGFAENAWPYSGDDQTRSRYEVMEYPVGISYWAWGTSWVTHWLVGSPDLDDRYAAAPSQLWGLDGMDAEITVFVLVNAVGFALLALLTVWFLTGVSPGRPWDAAAFALSPALALTGLINWDLIAVALVAAALWAWTRERTVLTGVLIGLGVAAKLYPLFLLGGLLVLCLRRRRIADFTTLLVTSFAAWLAANAPAYLTGREQWRVFWDFNAERGADLGSLWLLVDQATDIGFAAGTINTWSWALFALWCLGVFVLGMKAPEDPRLAQLGFLIVAGFLIINKVYSPQYVLWLLPLAVLARPQWRDQLVWQGGELFYFAMVWWYLGGFLEPAGGGDAGFYWVAILVRVAAELYLVALVARDVWRPEHDVVRSPRRQSEMTTRSTSVAV
ncbi:glycosyltransferase 87 family protein [Nocardioides panacisoli]|uniref:glycosyltransferase family 87 protein n=1 Tax=Nocardioides panacisoli TaxID=627624 RepID=UPI001C629CF9|nr:glycosyltransferase 87 family protein [Nocardioides panacisoli]QYJ03311.1 glycosyltransferase 87 family protein [Nocardioides panacisoli]